MLALQLDSLASPYHRRIARKALTALTHAARFRAEGDLVGARSYLDSARSHVADLAAELACSGARS